MREPSDINADINRALSQAIRLILLAQIVAVAVLLALPIVKQAGENWKAVQIAHEDQ